MTTKRSRGRPKGTTMNDERHLDAVADLIVRTPDLKKTPAISKIVMKAFPEQNWPAAERRLLRKWNETACERLEAAQQRRDEERSSRVVRRTIPSGTLFPDMSGIRADMIPAQSIFKDMQNLIDPPTLRRIREQAERMLNVIDPPTLRHIREQTEMMRKAFEPLGLR